MAIEPISQFYSAIGRYPGNNKQWWVARAEADNPDTGVKAGDFLPQNLDTLYSGNNRAPRGHFIINPFYKDRSAVSGIPSIPVIDNGTRAYTTAFFSGRAWWAGNSEVYYSQVIDGKFRAGLCYQEADPTAEDINDLIDSDGGQVPIPEATKINKLIPFSNGVIVFATNGVWFISGGDSAFSATNISVSKISSFGTRNFKSIVVVNDTILWWSEIGIQAIEQASGQFGPIPGKFGNTNISEQTIQTFYNNIPDECKLEAKGEYDPKNNVIQWLYSGDGNKPASFDRVLIYDITLQAFYPWSVSSFEVGPELIGIFLDTSILSNLVDDVVTSSSGNVTNDVLQNVTVSILETDFINRPTNLTYVTKSNNKLTFSKFNNRNFADWESYDGTGLSFYSFIETGYELNNDAMRRKQSIYTTVFFRRTEDDSLGVPTSCKFRAKWDWSANNNSNKWSSEIEAYRPKTFLTTTTADTEAGMPVVYSKNKVRGSGKAVQFRFGTSEIGKNFDLLGWAVTFAGNTRA